MKDVYAGDDGLRATAPSLPHTFRFLIVADPDPDVLLRVASQLLLSNLAPSRLVMNRDPDDSVTIEATLSGIGFATAESIRRKLSQLTCAQSVQMQPSGQRGPE